MIYALFCLDIESMFLNKKMSITNDGFSKPNKNRNLHNLKSIQKLRSSLTLCVRGNP